MKQILPDDIREATRLTAAGKLGEATRLLQRLLGSPDQKRATESPPIIDAVAEAPSSGDVADDVTPGFDPRRATQFDSEAAFNDGIAAVPGFSTGRKAGTKQAWQGLLDPGLLDWPSRGSQPIPRAAGMGHSAHPALPPGARFLAATFSNQAGTRPYKLYVPSGYRPEERVPLIVMLHGCTQSPDDFAAGTRMNEAAEDRTCLVVYPGQTSGANMQRCWNWFSEADQRRDQGEPSLIAGITRQVMRDYAIDPSRVYVAGLSAGGAAAAVMADAYPDLYGAVGVHSGLACGAARDVPSALAAMRSGSIAPKSDSVPGHGTSRRMVPAIVFHGDQDSTVHPRNGDAVVAQTARFGVLDGRTLQGKVPGGHAYRRTFHTDAAGRTVVEQWVVHGAGHAWFGGSSAGSYTDPRGPDATKEMIRFFMDHPRPE